MEKIDWNDEVMKSLNFISKNDEDNIEWTKKQWISEIKNLKTNFVYIIKMDKYYKIGISKNPIKRISQLDITSLPKEPKILYIFNCYDSSLNFHFELEKKIHNELTKYRTRGEWFKFSEETLNKLVNKYGFENWDSWKYDFWDDNRNMTRDELEDFYENEYN